MYRLREFVASDRAWLVAQHGALYAQNDGFDDSFAPLVDRILGDFLDQHDPTCEAGWIAERDGQPLGSIFCVTGDAGFAKLRLFLVMPAARGTGLAQMLLDQCLQFAKDSQYLGVRLWTHESHVAACKLYAKNGFSCTASKSVENFGQNLVEQTWERTF